MALRSHRLRQRSLLTLAACLAAAASVWLLSCAQTPTGPGTPGAERSPANELAEDTIETELYRGELKVCSRQVLIKFVNPPGEIDMDKMANLAKEYAGEDAKVERVGGGNVILVRSLTRTADVLVENFNRAINDKKAEYVSPDFVVTGDAPPNDRLFANLWGLNVTAGQTLRNCGTDAPGISAAFEGDVDINAVEAWAIAEASPTPADSRPVVVAVLDSGVNYEHVDLRGSRWTAPTKFDVNVRGKKIGCEAGTHGFNALTSDPKNRCDPMPKVSGHGTQATGIISATRGNDEGIAGVSRAQFMGVKVYDNVSNEGCLHHVLDGIAFVTAVKQQHPEIADLRVLNNSYGYTCPAPPGCDKQTCEPAALCPNLPAGCDDVLLREEIQRAFEAGLLFVASAGNEGTNNNCNPHFPASCDVPNVISVAGTDQFGGIAPFNFGSPAVDIGAPSLVICTTQRNADHLYGYHNGTSFAAPFVTGAAALILTRCGGVTTVTLKDILLGTTEEIKPSPTPRPILRGRLSVARAVTRAIATPSCTP